MKMHICQKQCIDPPNAYLQQYQKIAVPHGLQQRLRPAALQPHAAGQSLELGLPLRISRCGGAVRRFGARLPLAFPLRER